MAQENFKDEWLDKAFRLAFFLHGDRETAKKIAANAMSKLEAASNAQFKRYYYNPTGRAENSRAARSRVSLNDLQLLQRLVFVESEIFERENETSEQNLLKFFIKHLVRISLKRNSFYVALGISRILHNYGTADAMEIYNIIVQDPERVHDDYYYRSRKGVLMKELKARFGELLQIVKVNRGEERFEAKIDNKKLLETANESLKTFTPWNSSCAIPDKFNPFNDIIKAFYFDKNDPDEEHRIEVNRIHAALDPGCFLRLTNALKLPASKEKMEIPKFMLTENQTNFDDKDWRNPPNLEADELKQIKEVLASQAESRKAMSAGFLRVVADGETLSEINLAETDSASLSLDESAELVEVYGENETLLAAHLLSFAELQNGDFSDILTLEKGQKITFNFAPVLDKYGEPEKINLVVNYAETQFSRRFALALLRAKFAFGNLFTQSFMKPALTFGLILIAVTFGWFVFRNLSEKREQIAGNPTPQIEKIENKLPVNQAQEEKKEVANANVNSPQEEKPIVPKRDEKTELASNKTPKREVKKEVVPKKQVRVKEPQTQTANNNLRKDETDENGILRLPIRENIQRNPDFEERNKREAKRNYEKKLEGKPLNEINLIYIEISGDEILGKQIAEKISAEIGKSGKFSMTNDKESADGALKIQVRREANGDTNDDSSVTAVIRLVNAKGFVVYPNQKGISGWKYVGTVRKIPARISSDLSKAKK